MNYEEYLKKGKNFIKKTTFWQRMGAIFLVVVILATVIVLMNPAKKFLEMRNSQRRLDVVVILNAVYQYSVDHDGELPATITSEPVAICKSKATSCEGLVDISEIIANKKYAISLVPVDPKMKSVSSSGYEISKLANGRISVEAPLAENNAVIKFSK